MDLSDGLVERFEEHRSHLRAVAYRMLGSVSEADDALQEAWLRVDRAGTSAVDNPGGWLTTIVAPVCLNQLRWRRTRREDPIEVSVPDPIVGPEDSTDPEHQALLADSVGLALMVVLETLTPGERLAFVLHELFAVPFDQVATILGRSPAATRKLASRARQQVQAQPTAPDTDLTGQREVVDAFFAAARDGDFDALVAVLDPDIVARTDGGPSVSVILSGAAAVAADALSWARRAPFVRPALVNGVAGVVVAPAGRPVVVMAFTVRSGKIVAIDGLADRQRLQQLDLAVLDR